MAASSISTFVVVFNESTDSQRIPQKERANCNLKATSTFELFIPNNIRTLSTNTDGNSDVEGLLYVPDLALENPCVNETARYIPLNATKIADLPQQEKRFVALAPWTTPDCVLSYLEAAHDVATGFIFYLPNSGGGIPPPVNDPAWGLNDGGSWKSKNKYPVYAIPGTAGATIMAQLGVYSGNIDHIGNSSLLQPQYSLNDDLRMYAIVDTADNTNLPSLWAFLLIVLGIVLVLIGLTSCVMHLHQRRRRHVLRRRIADGEVDLELLGIKRLTVPQEAIDRLPLFIYTASEKDNLNRPKDQPAAKSKLLQKILSSTDLPYPDGPDAQKQRSVSDQLQLPPPPSPSLPSSKNARTGQSATTFNQKSYTQPTCPICLDDFLPSQTTVRSLPCYHIYHPECIDTFLRENSSLCPVCKSKVLSPGYCPEKITNAMVRRERQQRRNRERIRRIRGDDAANQMPVASRVNPTGLEGFRDRVVAVQGRMASFHRQFGQGRSTRTMSAPVGVEMRILNGQAGQTQPPPEPSQQQQEEQRQQQQLGVELQPPGIEGGLSRSERARRRASALLGHQRTGEEEEQARWTRLPRCKSQPFSSDLKIHDASELSLTDA
ncbi:MAG: hypothetical protein LQ342_000500 [Letrouitia transgressa]|nr:MAG: hypothetical protein LQ342_000500 [Letrouitia transgressa]